MPMPMFLRLLLIAVCIVWVRGNLHAVDIRDVDWPSLLPPEATDLQRQLRDIQLKIRALPADQQKVLPDISTELFVEERLASGSLSIDKLTPTQRRVLEEKPSEKYPEAASYWTKVAALQVKLKALEKTTNDTLNGQRIRMSGYLLPLELDRDKASQFLLVPFVGACIHVPPPPPNQIVQVSSAEGYRAGALYAPVTVTGTLLTTHGQVNLFLTDGEAMVDRGYRLDADTIKPIASE